MQKVEKNIIFMLKINFFRLCPLISGSPDNESYGPADPGRKKPSIFVLLFFQIRSWCGLGNEGIKVWSNVTFLRLIDLHYWWQTFKDLLMEFLRYLFNRLKNMQTCALKISLHMTPTHILLHTYEKELVLNFSKHPQHGLIGSF